MIKNNLNLCFVQFLRSHYLKLWLYFYVSCILTKINNENAISSKIKNKRNNENAIQYQPLNKTYILG